MTRSGRGSKCRKIENTRRLTRREKSHQLRSTVSFFEDDDMFNLEPPPSRNPFEALLDVSDRPSYFRRTHKRDRCRARKRRENSPMDRGLADLNAELSSRISDVIGRTQTLESPCVCWLNKRLPDALNFDLSMEKLPSIPDSTVFTWQPFTESPVQTSITKYSRNSATTSNIDWSNIERFLPNWKPSGKPSRFFPPVSLMTAAELGLSETVRPIVKLPPSGSYDFASEILSPKTVEEDMAISSWTVPFQDAKNVLSRFPETPPACQESLIRDVGCDEPPEHRQSTQNDGMSFVAARLPMFDEEEQDFTQTVEIQREPTSVRCKLYEPHLLDRSHANLSTFFDNGDVDIRQVNDSNVGSPNTVEHDAEIYGWTFLTPQDDDMAMSLSSVSSALSSMEFLPLSLSRLSSLEEETEPLGEEYHHFETVRSLADDDDWIVEVPTSAWDTESDFCIPEGILGAGIDGDPHAGFCSSSEDQRG